MFTCSSNAKETCRRDRKHTMQHITWRWGGGGRGGGGGGGGGSISGGGGGSVVVVVVVDQWWGGGAGGDKTPGHSFQEHLRKGPQPSTRVFTTFLTRTPPQSTLASQASNYSHNSLQEFITRTPPENIGSLPSAEESSAHKIPALFKSSTHVYVSSLMVLLTLSSLP